MTNIASNETASFDVRGKWVNKEHCQLTFHLNEDGHGDTEINYMFDLYDLVFLRDILIEFIDSCPRE